MATEDDVEELIAKAQSEEKEARLARDKAEKVRLFNEHPEYFTGNFIVEEFPRLPAALCGCVVMRMPTVPEQTQLREMILGQGAAVKARSLIDFQNRCRVYPDKDSGQAQYKAMLDASPGIADQCANVLYRASEGKEREAGKG